jgi:hypothetical protein
MLDIITRRVDPTIDAQAWRVEFAEDAKTTADGAERIEIAEPRKVSAVFAPLDVSKALSRAEPETPGGLTVIWLPPGVKTPATIERDADEWIRAGGARKREANVRADLRTVRVLWDEGRALIYASPSDIRFAVDAIFRFCVVQREALALDARMKSAWASIEADSALTHSVTRRQQRKQPHVNEMTEIATRMKADWLRVTNSLEQLDPTLAEPSKRLFAELVSGAALYDRMEMLEDPIQFALDHYELANTRLIEANVAHKERINAVVGYVFEAAIIALLGYQIVHFLK